MQNLIHHKLDKEDNKKTIEYYKSVSASSKKRKKTILRQVDMVEKFLTRKLAADSDDVLHPVALT